MTRPPNGRGDPIVVAGEALVDLVPAADGTLGAHPGGGPYNAARTVGRLGQPVAYLGRLSTDRFGRRLRAELVADGVSLTGTTDTDDPTTLALAEVGEAGVARYRFYTAGTSAAGLEPAAALAALPAATAALHVGTLGLVLEPMATALEAAVEAVGDDVVVLVDPNCRPWAITDEPTYRARLARVVARADVVKVSEEDLAWLEPELPPLDAARRLAAAGSGVVLVTRGADGAVVVAGDRVDAVPAPAVELVDTIGAGDAFGGAFLAWWRRADLGRGDVRRHDAVIEATRFACLVAARTCERAGAVPPRLAELRD